MADAALAHLLRRDRWIAAAGLAGVTALAWAYLALTARGMDAAMAPMAATAGMPATWGVADLLLTFVMWAVMMAAMMVPSAAPMVLLYVAVARGRDAGAAPAPSAGIMLGGYLLLWTAFSALATLAQWGLHAAALLTPMMESASPVLSGTLLVLAGAYQWAPAKHRCLDHCRSPLEFLSAHWRPGPGGAFRMGVDHGLYCLGCCWSLMLLLFVLGVMQLAWVAALAALVLAERLVAGGPWIARAAGAGLAAWGAVLLAEAALA